MKYKCYVCKIIVDEQDLVDSACPVCMTTAGLQKMCARDHCYCPHEVIETVAYCPECGQPICPECGTHDVVVISRVTGYLQEVGGWNSGKQQELKDRARYTI